MALLFFFSQLCHEAFRILLHPTPVLLPGKSHGWRSLVGCSPWGCYESDATERLHFHFSLSRNGEGNGNPLQCSCLENPRDGRAWWAAVYEVTQSQIWLKRLSSSSSTPTKDGTWAMAVKALSPRHWSTRELPCTALGKGQFYFLMISSHKFGRKVGNASLDSWSQVLEETINRRIQDPVSSQIENKNSKVI